MAIQPLDKVKAEKFEEQVKIKKVILENFLSFQKDEIDFSSSSSNKNPRLILIIGPNWSGKTSVFQAIKFGLGSNERDDRYKKWADFIRNDKNHAMVEIQLQYGLELIKIRRIVIRGKSPYFEIQRETDKEYKKISVIKVQELISNLKINPDNHFAFVSQGKIDAIKNLNPVELCSFLEEGIGLKGLREEILSQKHKILQLNRDFKSIISKKNALNISLDTLIPKLKKLEIKKKLIKSKEELNDELLWANREKLVLVIVNLREELSKLNADINDMKENINQNQSKLKDYQGQVERINSEVNQNSVRIGKLNNTKENLTNNIENWKEEKVKQKIEIEDLKKRISNFQSQNNKMEKKQNQIKKEISKLYKEKSELIANIDQLILEQSNLNKKLKENSQWFNEYENYVSEKVVLENKIKFNETEIEDLNRDMNDVFQSLQDIENSFQENQWFLENPSNEIIQEIEDEIQKLSEDRFNNQSRLKQLELETSKLSRNLSNLKLSNKERRIILPSNVMVLKEEIKKKRLNVKGPIIDYLKYDDNLSYAIESVLGERLLYSFIASDWKTLSIIKNLKNKYNAYCNIYLPKKNTITPLKKIEVPGAI
jgi:chromosome segregation ATPase